MRHPLLVLAAVVAGVGVAAAASAAPAQTPKRGGTLFWLQPEFAVPVCLNPFTCEADNHPGLLQVIEGAFEVGPDLVWRPNLVSGVTRGANRLTLVYHVRPEAHWSDGVPVTARDFQFTHKAFAAHYPDPDGLYANVRSTRVLDARTFEVTLRKPTALWRLLYGFVLPWHALAGSDVTKVWRNRIDNPRTGQPIASGPFFASRLDHGRQLTLVRNPRYWGPHTAYLDRLVFRILQENTSDPLQPLRDGKVQAGLTLGNPTPVSAEAAREIRKLPGWRIAAWPTLGMEHFVFRVGPGGHPALGLKLVRQALAYGIDRVAIAREIQQDVEPRYRRPLDSTVYLPTEPFYLPNWSRYSYDVAKSRRLLEQAGCRRGSDGIYVCAGERLHLRFVTSAGAPVRERVVALASAQLRAVGVDVEPRYAPSQVFLRQILPNGDFDAALFSWGSAFGGTLVFPEVLCGNEQNFGGYCSRLVSRDAEQNLLGSAAERARNLNALDRKIADAVPVLPVVQPVVRMFYRSEVRGIVPGGSHFEFMQNSEDWWLAAER